MQSHDCLIYFRYFAQNTTGSCERCHKGCKECTGPQPTDCLFCDTYFYLLRSKNECVSSCPEYFYESKDNVCERCHPSCRTCEGKVIHTALTRKRLPKHQSRIIKTSVIDCRGFFNSLLQIWKRFTRRRNITYSATNQSMTR